MPLILLFSGTVFTGAPGTISVSRCRGTRRRRCGCRSAVWREAMDAHFPGQAWLRLTPVDYDGLAAYRGGTGWSAGTTWSPQLLEEAGE